jgi:SAM-dependent methyltransferase
MFAFFGARRVYGADHNEEKIALFEKLLAQIQPEIENVSPSLQDGLTLNYESGKFPAIFVKDVISHVRELAGFLDEMSRLLAPGGLILITDENNALEFAGKRERREKWLAWESRGVKAEELRKDEPHQTYFEMRREDIANHISNLDLPSSDIDRDKLLDNLAAMTKGLWGDEITQGVNQILESGELKIKPEFLYRHPRTGEFMEREFNPFKLANEMGNRGINARVVPARFFTQKPMLNFAGKAISALHPLSIYIQPNFYILGEKR